MSKPTATIKGNKRDGYILEVSNSEDNYCEKITRGLDHSLLESELIEIYKAIGKKLKI